MRNHAVSQITHHELARWLKASAPEPQHRDEGYALVDVRSPQAHARLRIPGALQVGSAQMGSTLSRRYAPEKVIVVYDEQGTDVEEAAERLAAVGFRRVQCLVGGVEAWVSASLPLEGGFQPVRRPARPASSVADGPPPPRRHASGPAQGHGRL